MKIKATFLLLLLSAFLLNAAGSIYSSSHSHCYTPNNPVADAIASAGKYDYNIGLQSPEFSKPFSRIIQDYYQTDVDDDSFNTTGFHKPQKAPSFSSVRIHDLRICYTATSLLKEATPKRYILFRVFII